MLSIFCDSCDTQLSNCLEHLIIQDDQSTLFSWQERQKTHSDVSSLSIMEQFDVFANNLCHTLLRLHEK
jgi:hypothetical protein